MTPQQKQQYDYLMSDEFWLNIIRSKPGDESIGFGNPCSKLTSQQQAFLNWKMIMSGQFVDRDAFCSKMLDYSTLEQACEDLGFEYPFDLFPLS